MRTPSPNTPDNDSESFTTDDLTLVGVLYLHGYTEPKMHRQGDRRAAWVFKADEYLTDLVREYKAGTCTVEPSKLMNAVGKVRSDLYKFLGHSPSRVSSN